MAHANFAASHAQFASVSPELHHFSSSPTASEWERVAPNDEEALTLTKLYRPYEQHLANQRRNDFADQVMLTVRRLRDYADARERWQARFSQVLVDEYQDIEAAQELLVQLLAAPQDGWFAVGDEDQTLYSWRRASVERIVGLDQLYPGLERVSLERSRAVVEHNRRRFPKPIRPAGAASGEQAVLHREYETLEQAAHDVARRLAASERGQIVVLARTTRLLRTVAEACVEPG
jgi:superfamily I DNA/RNA helicase